MQSQDASLGKDAIKQLRDRIEYIILFSTAGISLFIAGLDLIGLLDTSSWIAQRLPTLTLLCVGFIASYLIIERRGKLDQIALLVEQRTGAILKAVGVEVITYESGGDLAYNFAISLRKARRIDDVTWMRESDDEREKWSGQDLVLYQHLQDTITEVSRKSDVIWREVVMFSNKSRFKREKVHILDPKTTGYNVAYFDEPSSITPLPRFGFAVINYGKDNAEVFLSSSKVRLKIRHPAVVDFFSQYFERVWDRAKKLKLGNTVEHTLLQELETQLEGNLEMGRE